MSFSCQETFHIPIKYKHIWNLTIFYRIKFLCSHLACPEALQGHVCRAHCSVLSCRETRGGFTGHYQPTFHKISLLWMSSNLSTQHTWRQTLPIGKQFAEPFANSKHFWTFNSNNFSAGQYSDWACFWDILNYPEEPGELSAKFLPTLTDLIWPLKLSRLFWKPQFDSRNQYVQDDPTLSLKHDLFLLQANDGVPAGVQGVRSWITHLSSAFLCYGAMPTPVGISEATVKALHFLQQKLSLVTWKTCCRYVFLMGYGESNQGDQDLELRVTKRIRLVQPLEEKMNGRPYSCERTKEAEPGSSGRCTALMVIALTPCVSWRALP